MRLFNIMHGCIDLDCVEAVGAIVGGDVDHPLQYDIHFYSGNIFTVLESKVSQKNFIKAWQGHENTETTNGNVEILIKALENIYRRHNIADAMNALVEYRKSMS